MTAMMQLECLCITGVFLSVAVLWTWTGDQMQLDHSYCQGVSTPATVCTGFVGIYVPL